MNDAETPPLPDVLRTPEARFADLPGFPWAPRYLSTVPGFEGLRIHYLDEGPADAEITVLCLHGQPTWSYLYRKMLPVFVAAGQRVVAPDFIGFGRSDKPEDEAFYTFTRHREMLLAFVRGLGLSNVTLVVQDWGGLLGLTLPMALPGVIRRLVVMNTMLGTGDLPLGQGFLDWRAFSNSRPDMDVAALMARSTPVLSAAEAQAYAAPFPDARYKAGVRRFPNLVPDNPDADGAAVSRQAREWLSTQWDGQSFMAVGMRDPVLGPPAMTLLRSWIRGCPAPMEVAEGGHFVQEHGEAIARAALAAFARAGA
ncbi:haloalkane dehalogenase [Burkholderiaceae bacterium FT117]|uniref:haloalkane dehalogenase n=1 Tax=Zeimonas sediminis TaxID=2944268 RepID=UPI0023430BC7|nr:haloalkane dehalogenase [Zeimonas sediminis]MCM5569454.1 haloalkane dehalogenase [Zeimonas sediminis]